MHNPNRMAELRTLVNLGFELARKGEYEEALKQFEIVLSHDSVHPDALYGAAACTYRLGDSEHAQGYIRRLVRLRPKSEKVLELQDRIDAALLQEASIPSRDQVVARREEVLEERLKGKGTISEDDLVLDWQPLDVRVPGIADRIREGKIEESGTLLVGQAYSGAWKHYRRHLGDLLTGTYVSILVILAAASFFASVLGGLSSVSHLLTYPFGFLACFFCYPLLSLPTYYCRGLAGKGTSRERWIASFFDRYPYLLFSQQWLFSPGFALAAWALLGYVSGGFSVKEFYRFTTVWDGVTPCLLAAQGYLSFRCWFVSLVVFEQERPPLVSVSRAFFLTRKQHLRLLGFIWLQTLLLSISILSLGILLPWMILAQIEGYKLVAGEDGN